MHCAHKRVLYPQNVPFKKSSGEPYTTLEKSLIAPSRFNNEHLKTNTYSSWGTDAETRFDVSLLVDKKIILKIRKEKKGP